jgi:hypothetical protein
MLGTGQLGTTLPSAPPAPTGGLDPYQQFPVSGGSSIGTGSQLTGITPEQIAQMKQQQLGNATGSMLNQQYPQPPPQMLTPQQLAMQQQRLAPQQGFGQATPMMPQPPTLDRAPATDPYQQNQQMWSTFG